MRGWRFMVRRVLPAVLAATCMLVPGLSARQVHKAKQTAHSVAKRRSRKTTSRRAHTTKRKVTHRTRRRRRYRRTRYHRRYRRRHFRGPARPTSNRIEQIQQALSRSGYYEGDPTGRWDSNTVAAMKSFQQAHGITPTGKINAPSLQQLGLGSDIAGLAPPRPVIPTNPPDSSKEGKGAGSR